MASTALINYSAQLLREYALQSGYNIASVFSVAKPLLFETAIDHGFKITLSELNDLENLLLNSTESNAKIVSFAGKKQKNKKEIDYIELKNQLQNLIEKIMSQISSATGSEMLEKSKSFAWVHNYKLASNGSFASFLKSRAK